MAGKIDLPSAEAEFIADTCSLRALQSPSTASL